MPHEYFVIDIGGYEADDLYPDLQKLEVDLDDEAPGTFRLLLTLAKERDGRWSYLNDERLSPWQEIAISAGFASGVDEVISGFITQIRPYFAPDLDQCTLEILGVDKSIMLDREERMYAWPNKKDSDIASEIFMQHGFIPAVDDTAVIHDETRSTIIQRETDLRFLQRLARRNGFRCSIEGKQGVFQAPRLKENPQPVLAVHFGDETNVTEFSLDVDTLTPTSITMFQVDHISKEIMSATTNSSRQARLGARGAETLQKAGVTPNQVYVGMNAATGLPEMMALTQGLFHEAEWFLHGSGEINGNQYEHVLKPRHTVTIKGVGEAYSGIYYVHHVAHRFSPKGYIQYFYVKRNALMPTGLEPFTRRQLGPLGVL